MSAKHVAGAVILTLVGLPLGAADNAQARGGGSTGSASSGQRHHGGGGSSSSSSSSSSSGSSGSSSGSSSSRDGGGSGGSRSRSAQSDAQRRHPRPGTGHGSFGSRRYNSPYYYRPYAYGYYGYYPSWYGGYYYGGYYDNPYYYGAYRSPYYSGSYRSGDVGSLRLLVDPSDTRVYVDGYFAGNVDDFDGLFQRLNLTRGRHELAFKLAGYRTYRMRVYVPSDQTLKIHYDMVRGTGEDIREEALGTPEDDRSDDRWARRERGDRDEDQADDDNDVRDRDREGDRDRRDDSADQAPRPSGGRGMVMLEVEPSDASIYVDGEFRGAARQARSLELTEGRHRVEVVRPGYKTFEREVEIRAGRSEVMHVALDRP